MDPNITLRQILLNANMILVRLQQRDEYIATDAIGVNKSIARYAERLANEVLDMNAHLRDGGCPPDAWTTRNRAAQYTS